MKKLLLPLIIAIVLISCTDEPISKDLNFKKVYFLEARAGDWMEKIDNNNLNRYYHCSFTTKGIDNEVFNDGNVTAFLDYGNYQQSLPVTRHYENANGEKWTRTIDFDYEIGKITFYVTNSDFAKDPPEAMNFKVVLMW